MRQVTHMRHTLTLLAVGLLALANAGGPNGS